MKNFISDSNSNPSTTTKKTWGEGPQLFVMGSNTVEGGFSNTFHEKSFTPVPGSPGVFKWNGNGTYNQTVFDRWSLS